MEREESNTALVEALLSRLGSIELSGFVKLEIRDDGAEAVLVRLNGKAETIESLPAGSYPDIIIRVMREDLSSLLQGRMSLNDALIAERISIAGDVSKIVRLKEAFAKPEE